MTSFLKLDIQIILDGFPDGIAIGANDHGATDGSVVRELGPGNDVKIPGIEVLRARSDEAFFVLVLLLLLLNFACYTLCGEIAGDGGSSWFMREMERGRRKGERGRTNGYRSKTMGRRREDGERR